MSESIRRRAKDLESLRALRYHCTYYHWRGYRGDTRLTIDFRPPFVKDYKVFIELERRIYDGDTLKVRIQLRFHKDGRIFHTLTHFHGLDKTPFVDFYKTWLV